MSRSQPRPPQAYLILAIGVLAISTAAIWIRLATSAANDSSVGFSLTLAASRSLLAALMLVPVWGDRPWRHGTPALARAVAAGVCFAVHIAAWIASLSYTSIAASTTLVTTNPLWVALLSWWWFGEKPTKRTIVGIFIALVGGIFVARGGQTGGSGSNPLLGDGLALLGAITFSLYLLLGREAQRRGLSLGEYSAIAYSVGALLLLPLPWLFGSGYANYPASVYGCMLMLALFSQLVGHTSINWAVRSISPTLVTLIILLEPLGATLLGYLVFAEVPGLEVAIGAVLLLAGVALAAIAQRRG